MFKWLYRKQIYVFLLFLEKKCIKTINCMNSFKGYFKMRFFNKVFYICISQAVCQGFNSDTTCNKQLKTHAGRNLPQGQDHKINRKNFEF